MYFFSLYMFEFPIRFIIIKKKLIKKKLSGSRTKPRPPGYPSRQSCISKAVYCLYYIIMEYIKLYSIFAYYMRTLQSNFRNLILTIRITHQASSSRISLPSKLYIRGLWMNSPPDPLNISRQLLNNTSPCHQQLFF